MKSSCIFRSCQPLLRYTLLPLLCATVYGAVIFEENFQNYTDVAPGVVAIEGISVGNDPIWANAAELNVRTKEATPIYVAPLKVPADGKFDLLVKLRFLNSVPPKEATAGRASFFDLEFALKGGKKELVRVAADKVGGFDVPFIANSQWEELAVKVSGTTAELHLTRDRAFQLLGTVKLAAEVESLNFIATAEQHFSLRDIVIRTPAPLGGYPVEKHFADFRALTQPFAGARTAQEGTTVSLTKPGSERIRLQMGSAEAVATMKVNFSDGNSQSSTLTIGTQEQNLRVAIGEQKKGEKVVLPDSCLVIQSLGQLYIRPNLKVYQSSYDCEPQYIDIVREWQRLPAASQHIFTLDFRQESGNLYLFVDESLFATFKQPEATFDTIDFTLGAGVKYQVVAKPEADPLYTKLDLFANPRAKAFIDAKLSLNPGTQQVKGIPMIVADGLNSADIAICKQGKGNWALEVEEYHGRTPFYGLPSAVHYRLPAAIYTKAHILFALDPDSRKDAVLTVRLGHYINNGSGGNMLGDVVIDLRDRKPLEYPGIEQVGTVQHRGRELPLYLATVDLAQAIGKIIDIATQRDYIDFELTGKGWVNFEQLNNEIKPDPNSDSAFNVFGITLKQAPGLSFAMRQASPGNIFTADEREKRLYVTVTDPRGVAQRLTWQGRDFEGQLLFQGEATSFSNEVAIDLAKAPVGYATLALALAGKDGQRLFEHEAAFAILPADDRQATIEASPYAVWWFNAHGSPGAAEIGGPILQKAGIRHASANLLKPEDAAKYQVVGTGDIRLPRATFDYESGKFKPVKVKRPDPADPKKQIEVEISGEEFIVEGLKEQIARTAFVTHLMLWHESAPGHGIPEELLLRPAPPLSEREQNTAKYVNEVGRIMRQHFPKIKIQIGNSSASIGAATVPLRGGANPDYYDAIGIETPSQVIPPERLIEVGLQGMQVSMDIARLLSKGREIPANGAYEFTYRCERDMGELKQAQWYVRDVLVTLAHNFTLISPGILFDCSNGYYNGLWGGSGLLRRAPYCYPKPAYVAYAALTRALDGVTFVRQLPTGSSTIYALEFKRCDGRMAYALWAARGEVEFELDAAANGEIVQFFGQASQTKAGRVKVAAGESPAYFITATPLKGLTVSGRSFAGDVALGMAAQVADTLDDAARITLSPDPLVALGHTQTMLPIMEPSDLFTITTVEDDEKGNCIEVTLGASEQAVSKYITEYTTLRLPQPAPIPGDPEVIGVWVKGNSNWGQIRFEIEDAQGEVFKNISTGSAWGCDIMDWPGNLAVSFDGWSYVYTALRQTDLVPTHSPGPISEQWVSGGGDKKIDFPIKLRAITVGMNRTKLNLTGFEAAAPSIRLKDAGGVAASGNR